MKVMWVERSCGSAGPIGVVDMMAILAGELAARRAAAAGGPLRDAVTWTVTADTLHPEP
jgi:hypothetical protein